MMGLLLSDKVRKRILGILWFLFFNSLLSIFIMVLFMNRFEGKGSLFIAFLWGFSICATQWGGLSFVAHVIDKRYSWMDAPVKKLLLEIMAFVLYSAGAFVVVQFVNFYIWTNVPLHQAWPSIRYSIPYTLLISFIISLIFFATSFFFDWKASFVQAEKLKAEMLAYKYESLRSQINPHFLFNSLNVLSDLVYDNQQLAIKFIRQLSDLFRYVIESRDKELVSLAEEVQFIRSYIFLLKTRFEEKLKIEIDLRLDDNVMIVPMTLQLLIENAVKHNEVSEAFPLHITICQCGEYIEVENDFRPKAVGEYSSGTGLKNIIQQFAFFSNKPIEVISGSEKFKVKIPVIQQIIS